MENVAAIAPRTTPKSTCIRRSKLLRVVRAEREASDDELSAELPQRPRNRSECGGARPCLFVTCRYHLAYDVTDGGSLKVNFPGVGLEEMEETCALDVADQGPQILRRVGRLMNVLTQRADQAIHLALAELAAKLDVDVVDAERALYLLGGRVPQVAPGARHRRRRAGARSVRPRGALSQSSPHART
jgi:hypothetical protein